MEDKVSIPELAKRMKVNPSTVRRIIASESENLSLVLHQGKQNRHFLSRTDAEKLIAWYETRSGPVSTTSDAGTSYERFGFFYLIQLVPERCLIGSKLVLPIM